MVQSNLFATANVRLPRCRVGRFDAKIGTITFQKVQYLVHRLITHRATAINGPTTEQTIFKAFADSPITGNYVEVTYTLNIVYTKQS